MRKLIQAVINQHDANAEEFLEMCKDVTNHGADAGFSGFIYYNETMEFYTTHKDEIMEQWGEYCFTHGLSIITALLNMPCLKSLELNEYETLCALSDTDHEYHQYVANAMAWFALEHVAHYCADAYDEERIADCFAFPKA